MAIRIMWRSPIFRVTTSQPPMLRSLASWFSVAVQRSTMNGSLQHGSAIFQDQPVRLMEPLGLIWHGGTLGSADSFAAHWSAIRNILSTMQRGIRRVVTTHSSRRIAPSAEEEVFISPSKVWRSAPPMDAGCRPGNENFAGAHLWWQSKDAGFRFRSGSGAKPNTRTYLVRGRFQAILHSAIWTRSFAGRIEPRWFLLMQQTFRIDGLASDSLPSVNTQRTDFGFDYNLPHNTRILTSYSRQFASAGKRQHLGDTGLSIAFLFPAWKAT